MPDPMLYAILCYHDEDHGLLDQGTGRRGHAEALRRAGQTGQTGPARPGGAAVADDGGDHLAQGRSAGRARRAVCRDQGTTARLLRRRLQEPRRGARRRARSRRGQSRRRLRDPPGRACSRRGVSRRDRHRLDRCRADLGASPGGRRAAALFPQSRYRRGSVPERLPARAEELAAERPAARSGGVADHGRAQRRDRRHQARPQAGAAARGRSGDLRPRRRRGGAGRTARRLALPRRYPAAAVHLLPSRSAGDAADRAGAAHRLRPDGEADRARLPGFGSRDGAAHHPRQGPRRRRRCAVRDAGRGGAQRAAGRGRRDDLSDLQRGLFGQRRHRRNPQRRCARRRSGWRGCCCGCSRASPRSWG